MAADAGQIAALASRKGQPGTDASQALGMVVYGPPQARYARAGQSGALVPYLVGKHNMPRASQMYGLAVYGSGIPDERRSRAWWFTFDGHTFYVLDLGEEGTYLYDTVTKQWSRWYTSGFSGQWNVKSGTMWGALRVVGGSAMNSEVYVLDPNKELDEGWREIQHVVTGGIMLRGRVFVGMSQLRLIGSAGQITSDQGSATVTMRFSDDMGKTWSAAFPVETTEGAFGDETSWRSLGSFMEPGRIIEISDIGGSVRIDALDASLDGFDEQPSPSMGGGRG